jgi:hypothetical protein
VVVHPLRQLVVQRLHRPPVHAAADGLAGGGGFRRSGPRSGD